jgi:hypothetical protein
MEIMTTLRVASSHAALLRLLDEIESGRAPKPDWIRCQAACRLDKFPVATREQIIRRLHGCVLRGFRANNSEIVGKRKRLEYWRSVARNGFHDFSDQGWMKCYDSPFIENYDYITPYLEHGLGKLDDYLLYTSVLGTLDYSVEDFVHTELCDKVETLVEPMAGTAEFSYNGHFRYPNLRYLMFDLDERAIEHVAARPWLPDVDRNYFVGDVLEESSWQKVSELSTGQTLTYIGKQSHHFFGARQLLQLLDFGTRYTDYFMLEVPEPTLMQDMSEDEDLSRPEMEDAGFEVSLVNEGDTEANPLTNRLSFNLEVSDKGARRVLFEYHEWLSWQHPMLMVLAELLDLNVYYFHSEESEFVTVEEKVEDSDCLDNVTFMMFTRHEYPRGGSGGPSAAG